MSPRTIVETAARRGIDIVAVCDHNSGENLWAAERASQRIGLALVPGIEVTTREEVHLVALFPGVAGALAFQSLIYARLPGENDEDAFGPQVVANEDDEVLGFCPRLLIGATSLSIDDAVHRIHGLGGLAIASHVDREAFGVIGQLGFVPPEVGLDALEVTDRAGPELVEGLRREYPHLAIVRSSDAHTRERIGAVWTELEMEGRDFGELALAIRGQEGRRVLG